MLGKIGIQSVKDFFYFLLITFIFLFVCLMLFGATYEVVTGELFYRPYFFPRIRSNVQFPYFLKLSVFLMYFGALIIFVMGIAGALHKDKNLEKTLREDKLISVIIPAHNEESVIKNILFDLKEQNYDNFEVFIIAHNCSDKTIKRAREIEDDRFRAVEYNSRRSGKGLALNRGLTEAKGEIIIHFDADNRIKDPDFISKAMAYFEDWEVDAIQTRLDVTNQKESFLVTLQKLEFNIFALISLAGREKLGLPCILAGTGTALRRLTVEEMGRWENSLVEDFQLFNRMSLAGKKIVFADNLTVYDEKPTSWVTLLKQRSRWFKGHLKVAWKNLHNYGNLIDYFYRLLPFSVMVWWISIMIYIFYFITGQYSVWDIGNELWLAWTISFQLMLIILLWKIGGIKKVVYFVPQVFFSFHWMITCLLSFKVKSWSHTAHKGNDLTKEGDYR